MSNVFRTAAIVFASMVSASLSHAQSYPSKPVRIVVPASAGGANTILARIMADRLQASLGQPFLVDNRGGAGGTIGANAVAKAAPDGYTLLLTYGGPISTGLGLLKSVPYDAAKDFAPISRVADVQLIMVSSPAFAPQNVKDVIGHANANPGIVTAYISTFGSMGHLLTEQFRLVTRVKINTIPYKGSGPALVDLFGGQINIAFDTLPITLPHIKSGRLRPLAIASATRSELVPEVPTFTELGMEGMEVTAWFALLAPAGTPADIVDRLSQESARILQAAEVRELVSKQGAIAGASTPRELATFMRQESEKWGRIIREAGLKPE